MTVISILCGCYLMWKKKRTGLSYSNGCCLNSFKLRGDQVAGVEAGCKDGGVQLLASCFPWGTFFCESGDAGGRYGTQSGEAIVDMKANCLQGKFNTFLCCRLLTFIELNSSLGSFTAASRWNSALSYLGAADGCYLRLSPTLQSRPHVGGILQFILRGPWHPEVSFFLRNWEWNSKSSLARALRIQYVTFLH